MAPVASSALSKVTVWPFESCALRSEGERPVTETRVSASTRCSSYQLGGRNSVSSRDSLPCRYPFEQGGRLYGRSGSRPTSRIVPSAPSSRSQRAQLPEARPPPISRYSTWRSATGGGPRAIRLKLWSDLRFETRIDDQQHLIA